jgi:rRNA-processing protein FCF1
MQTTEFKTDIASLESQFDHYNDLLDKAISKNVKFSITKIIYRKLKEISDKLKKIRGLWQI